MHLSHIIFSYHHTTAFHCILLVVFFIFFIFLSFILSTTCVASYSLYPEWWSSSVHYLENSHIISIIYPMDTDSEILSLKRSSCQIEFFVIEALGSVSIHYWYHIWGLFCSCSGYVYLYICKKKKKKNWKKKWWWKEKKNKHMCVCA